ncbi:MAG: hypothetical protein HOV80_07850 [Polyangiaceae bacterium]|nr:hypothetical protein [Polyangiaceae bacterium]
MVADEHAAVGAPTGRESPVTPRDRELDVGNAPTRIGGRPEAEVSSPASKEASAGESNPALGLAELVLLLVDVLRRLLERQAMRRVEDGDVSDERIERLGLTFAELEEQVREQLSRMRER